jgi:hypothetical protein
VAFASNASSGTVNGFIVPSHGLGSGNIMEERSIRVGAWRTVRHDLGSGNIMEEGSM